MSETDTGQTLVELADRLYAGSPEEFTDQRNAAAKGCGDKALAAQLKKLKKPSVAAWAVNLLVRREAEQIASVLALAESLRAAAEALDGDELRALTRQRRQLTIALATSARSLAREQGVRLTGPVVDQVEGMLTAAMLDPVAAQVVRTGRVLTAFTSTGVSELDVDAVVAVLDALDVHATPVEGPAEGAEDEAPAPVALRVVRDDGARLRAAQEALSEAAEELAGASQELAGIEESVEALNARRLQLQGEAEELRRRLAEIESGVDEVDDELEEAGEALEDAQHAVAEATRTHAEAEREVERLEGS